MMANVVYKLFLLLYCVNNVSQVLNTITMWKTDQFISIDG